MTGLRDEFENVLRREGKFDYVPWSSIADRLDEAAPGWSFAIMAIGPDWIHGRLTINGQHFENIGYAENATANYAKEVLKHAATDSFKRCAALAGVARYLYDKEADSQGNARSANHSTGSAPSRPPATVQERPQRPAAVAAVSNTPEEPEWLRDGGLDETPAGVFPPIAGLPDPGPVVDTETCPIHGTKWGGTPGDLFHGPKGVTPNGYCRHPENVKKAARRTA